LKVGFPQNALFSKNDLVVKFAKHPPDGISTYNSLKETFKYLRYESFSRDIEITPER
jgi:hypothetical protein